LQWRTWLRRTRVHPGSIAAACQCGWEPQPLASNVDQDLGEDERRCWLTLRSSKFVKVERHSRRSTTLISRNSGDRTHRGVPISDSTSWSACRSRTGTGHCAPTSRMNSLSPCAIRAPRFTWRSDG